MAAKFSSAVFKQINLSFEQRVNDDRIKIKQHVSRFSCQLNLVLFTTLVEVTIFRDVREPYLNEIGTFLLCL